MPDAPQGLDFFNDLNVDFLKIETTAQVEISPTEMFTVRLMQRNGKVLGHAIGIYDIAKDPHIAKTVHAIQGARLITLVQNRYVDINSGEVIPHYKVHDNCGFSKSAKS